MKKGDKIKVNGSTMFYNGCIPKSDIKDTIHVLVLNRRKVGTSAHDLALGEFAFRTVLKTGVVEGFN